jgi:hypothetical protein
LRSSWQIILIEIWVVVTQMRIGLKHIVRMRGRCDGDDKTKNHYGHVTIALLQGT